MDFKNDSVIFRLLKNTLQIWYGLIESRKMGELYNSNINQNKAGVAISIEDKVEYRKKKITRNREWYYIMMKESIHQEDIAFLNVYAPNHRTAKYVNQKLIELKGEIDKSTIIVGDFNIPLSIINSWTENWQRYRRMQHYHQPIGSKSTFIKHST